MQELIEAIKAWPVIVQGALGSALFWLVLLAGQRITKLSTESYSKHSELSRRSWLINASLKYSGAVSKDVTVRGSNATMLVYRSLRFLYKSIMWMALGLAMQSFLDISGVIGFIGCIYYLLRAYEVVAPLNSNENWEEKLKDIQRELSEHP